MTSCVLKMKRFMECRPNGPLFTQAIESLVRGNLEVAKVDISSLARSPNWNKTGGFNASIAALRASIPVLGLSLVLEFDAETAG